VSVVVRKRLPWLYVNLGTAFVASMVVGLFETTIQQVTALAVLMPIVAGQGGNTGAQSLAVVMRGIALREILPGSVARLVRKELLGALLNGLAVAGATGLAVWAWDGRIGLAIVIMLAMVVNMTAAGLFGAAIPLTLRALGRDPAQSASIFLTTVTDVVGFAAFLGFAALLLPILT
jgi:magnesium transporter